MLQTDACPAVTARLAARVSWMAGAPLAFGTSAPSRLVPVLHVVMGTPGAGVCEPASRRARIGSESRGLKIINPLGIGTARSPRTGITPYKLVHRTRSGERSSAK